MADYTKDGYYTHVDKAKWDVLPWTKELQTELATLRSLVREMSRQLKCSCTTVPAIDWKGDAIPLRAEQCVVCRILSRPEVVEILKEGEDGA